MGHVAATFDQRTYRFRNDDGSESSATWKDAENSPIAQEVGEVFRLRVAVQETSGGSANNQTIVLESNVNNEGWEEVGPTSPRVRLGASPHVGDQTPTTRQLGGTSGDFITGLLLTETSGTNISFSANSHTEVEWASLLITGEVSDGSTVEFRVTVNGALTDTVTASPSLTATVSAPSSAPVLSSPAKSESTVDLAWTEVGGVSGYRLQRGGDTIYEGASTSFQDTGLDPETTYTYRVLAYNDGGDGPWSDDLLVTTEAFSLSGGSESGVSVSAEGAGSKTGEGASDTLGAGVSAQGDGAKGALGASDPSVAVSAEGGGGPTVYGGQGGSETSVAISVESDFRTRSVTAWSAPVAVETADAEEEHFGGSTASVAVSIESSGVAGRSSGSETSVGVSTEGAGFAREHASGGSFSTVECGAEAQGQSVRFGSSSASTAIGTTGEGHRSGVGGADADVLVTSEGAGRSARSSGAESSVWVGTEGSGTSVETTRGGSQTSVEVFAEGGASASRRGSGEVDVAVSLDTSWSTARSRGSETTIEVSTEGGGTSVETVRGGSTARVEVLGEAQATTHRSGGSTSSVGVFAEGGGSGLEDVAVAGGSTASVSVSPESLVTTSRAGASELSTTVGVEGGAVTSRLGGHAAVVWVTTQGAGVPTEVVQGGSTTGVAISLEATGTALRLGSSETPVYVESEGAYRRNSAGGENSYVVVFATGDGLSGGSGNFFIGETNTAELYAADANGNPVLVTVMRSDGSGGVIPV